MSKESQLLSLVDSLIVELLSVPPEGRLAQWLDPMAGLARQTAGCADSLGLADSTRLAREFAGFAEAAASHTMNADLAKLALALQDRVEQLQNRVESELGARFASQAAGIPAEEIEITPDAALLRDFIHESREHLETIERELLALDREPSNLEPIHAVFRGFHTIKGLAGIFRLKDVRDLAHEVETLLDLVRAGHLPVTGQMVDVVLASSDYLSKMINDVEVNMASGGGCTIERPTALLARLCDQMMPPDDPFEGEFPEKSDGPEKSDCPEPVIEGAAPAAVVTPPPDAPVPPLSLADAAFARVPEPAAAPGGLGADDNSTTGVRPHQGRRSGSGSQTVKVDTGKLDALVDMVGELVIAQSLVHLDPSIQLLREPRVARNLSHLARITTDLQKTAMSLRVVPIASTFQRMSRVFRDIVQKSGKEATLELIGEDAELDRTIVEQLADPLMHMVRNAVDHGLENPADRAAAGKPREGRLRLAAYHRSGYIMIEVSDDGHGLNRTKILKRAIERGLVAGDANPSPSEILDLIFEPGFSTAEKVTDVSGRGVGMDVVKKQIQKLRGRIDVRTEEGKGSTFLLKLPLTLAIIDALVVTVGQDRYILPLFAVQEILRPVAGMISTIEGRREVALVRDRVLPVLRLSALIKRPSRSDNPVESAMVVLEIDGGRYGLMVDEVLGKQEVVIKSLGDWFGNLPGIAGGAILGDGCVGVILDLEGLVCGGGYAAAA